MRFPKPVTRGPSRVWRLSDLLRYEAAKDGRPLPLELSPEHEQYLGVQSVAKRYDKSVSTIWRWCSDAKSGVAA